MRNAYAYLNTKLLCLLKGKTPVFNRKRNQSVYSKTKSLTLLEREPRAVNRMQNQSVYLKATPSLSVSR